MNRILKIGLDVHTTNFTICIAEPQLGSDGNFLLNTQTKPDVKLLLDVVNSRMMSLISHSAMRQDVLGTLYIKNLKIKDTSA